MRARHAGFTLIEVLVVVAILGIIAAMALPNFSVVLANSSVRSTADQLRDTVTRARLEALKRNAPVVVAANSGVITLTVSAFGSTPAFEITRFTVKASVSDSSVTLEGSGRASEQGEFSVASPAYACKAAGGPIDCYRLQVFKGGVVRTCDPAKEKGEAKACI